MDLKKSFYYERYIGKERKKKQKILILHRLCHNKVIHAFCVIYHIIIIIITILLIFTTNPLPDKSYTQIVPKLLHCGALPTLSCFCTFI